MALPLPIPQHALIRGTDWIFDTLVLRIDTAGNFRELLKSNLRGSVSSCSSPRCSFEKLVEELQKPGNLSLTNPLFQVVLFSECMPPLELAGRP